MNRKTYLGIAALIIVLIAAGGFMYWQWSTVQQLKEQLAEDEKMPEEKKEPIAENNLPPAEPGKKWVPHGDHFHQVPMDAPDTWQEGQPEPIPEDVPMYQPPPTQTYHGPLTFHAELLKTNPVKALRLQAEERGHWSAEWIPPFPPEDTEAAEYARAEYLTHYYRSIGDTDNPALEKVVVKCISMVDTIMSYPFGARRYDLMKLTWPSIRSGVTMHTDSTPSDYFPNYHTDRGMELLLQIPAYRNLLTEEEVQRKLDEIRSKRSK